MPEPSGDPAHTAIHPLTLEQDRVLELIAAGAPLAQALDAIVVLIERQLLQRIYVKEEVLQLLVTFAVFMILEDVQRLVWGVQPYFVDTPLSLLGTLEVGGVYYTRYQLLLLPAAAVAVLS